MNQLKPVELSNCHLTVERVFAYKITLHEHADGAKPEHPKEVMIGEFVESGNEAPWNQLRELSRVETRHNLRLVLASNIDDDGNLLDLLFENTNNYRAASGRMILITPSLLTEVEAAIEEKRAAIHVNGAAAYVGVETVPPPNTDPHDKELDGKAAD